MRKMFARNFLAFLIAAALLVSACCAAAETAYVRYDSQEYGFSFEVNAGYAVYEQDGFVWVYPGQNNSNFRLNRIADGEVDEAAFFAQTGAALREAMGDSMVSDPGEAARSLDMRGVAMDAMIYAYTDAESGAIVEGAYLWEQREGYALKRGKYISARAPGQERFTRLKTLGADYAEDALTARMAGRARPSRQPKQRGGRVSLLIDIQNNIKAQQSAGYRHWATIENLKRIAETSNFLTEHGIGSMEELTERCEAASASAARLKAELRETGARIEELTLKMKHVAAYRQLKPIYDRYQASKDKEKFLRGYEREIILFEAAARECKRLGAVPLPSAERMQAEMDALTARRAALTAERQKARREEQDYAAVRRNVEEFLSPPRQVPARQKDMELE